MGGEVGGIMVIFCRLPTSVLREAFFRRLRLPHLLGQAVLLWAAMGSVFFLAGEKAISLSEAGSQIVHWSAESLFYGFIALLAVIVLIVTIGTAGDWAAVRAARAREPSSQSPPSAAALSLLLAAICHATILGIAVLPLGFLLGGLCREPLGRILAAGVIIEGAAVVTAIGALICTIRSRRAPAGAMGGILFALFWNIGFLLLLEPIVSMAARWMGWGSPRYSLEKLYILSPIFALGGEYSESYGAIGGLRHWMVSAAISGALVLLGLRLLLVTVRSLDPITLRHGAAEGPAPVPGRRCRGITARWLLDPWTERFPIIRNAPFRENLRIRSYARAGFRRCLFWGSLAFFLVPVPDMYTNTFHYDGIQDTHRKIYLITCAAMGLMMIAIPMISAWPRTEGELRRPGALRGGLLSGLYAFGGIPVAAILAIGFFCLGVRRDEVLREAALSSIAVILTMQAFLTAVVTASGLPFRSWSLRLGASLLLAPLLCLVLPDFLGSSLGPQHGLYDWLVRRSLDPWGAAADAVIVGGEGDPRCLSWFFLTYWAMILAVILIAVGLRAVAAWIGPPGCSRPGPTWRSPRRPPSPAGPR